MVKQSMLLDPDAQSYTDDEIVGKVNAATANITRADAVESTAVDLSGKDADDLPESASKKWAGETGATIDQTGAEIKTAYEAEADAFTDTKNTKLTGIAEGAQPDQTGAEMVTALEGLGAGSRLGSDKIDQEVDSKFLTDAEETKVAAIDSVFTSTEKTKLTGVEEGADANVGEEFTTAEQTKLTGIDEGAKVDQTGPEVRDLIVAIADNDRKILITEPTTGEFRVISVQRTAAGKTEVSYDDVAEP